jgi:hypothetical protein
VILVRTDVSEERITSIITVTRILFLCSVIRMLFIASVVLSTPILVTLMMEMIRSSEMVVFPRATRCHIPDDSVLQVNQ